MHVADGLPADCVEAKDGAKCTELTIYLRVSTCLHKDQRCCTQQHSNSTPSVFGITLSTLLGHGHSSTATATATATSAIGEFCWPSRIVIHLSSTFETQHTARPSDGACGVCALVANLQKLCYTMLRESQNSIKTRSFRFLATSLCTCCSHPASVCLSNKRTTSLVVVMLSRALLSTTTKPRYVAHAVENRPHAAGERRLGLSSPVPVSYTHLTLPTKRIV